LKNGKSLFHPIKNNPSSLLFLNLSLCLSVLLSICYGSSGYISLAAFRSNFYLYIYIYIYVHVYI
jgi:hypothetical protein